MTIAGLLSYFPDSAPGSWNTLEVGGKNKQE